MLNSTHAYLKQALSNLLNSGPIETENTQLETLLQRLFSESMYTVTHKTVGFNEIDNDTLADNALSIEQEIKQDVECSLEKRCYEDSLATFQSQNKLIEDKHLLSQLDLEAALLQLAKENPKQSTELLSCPVIAIANLTEEKKIETLSNALKKVTHYPAHIILNTGNHWTRLFLSQEKKR